MNVRIYKTNKVVKLTIIDSKTGLDWTQDLLGNSDAFGSVYEGKIDIDPRDDTRYVCTRETYEWWKNYIEGYIATEQDIETLCDKHPQLDPDDVKQLVYDYGCDMEGERSSAIRTLQEIEREREYKITYEMIATQKNLWEERVDPDGNEPEAFDLTINEKIAILVELFGPEE
jgi:hypothetical protein